MKRYDYLIIGGGMAADAAVRGIRERDGSGTIGLLTAEAHPPYSRPPLTKALWKGEPEESIWRGTESLGVTLHLGTRAVGLEPGSHRVMDGSGEEYVYRRLLLATGGRPRRLPGAGPDVIAFRSLDDYRRLREAARPGSTVVVLGGGFIGSELAASLTAAGAAVTLVVPEPAIGARVFPVDLANSVTELFRARDVDVRTNDLAESVQREQGGLVVRTRNGLVLRADAVVAGLGIEPETDLAHAAGLATQDGILVDLALRTSHPDVFAAGDVASIFSPALGRRRRVEHEDAAVTMGMAAGHSMAGDASEYTHLPFFYSDLFELGYEAVGDLDSRLATHAEWKEPFREGVVYYRREGRVVGVLLWNVWGKVDRARELVSGAAVTFSALATP
jgi:3-phenylpropionate/trans-cinnamate dioxygenase ferredoxin reductase component